MLLRSLHSLRLATLTLVFAIAAICAQAQSFTGSWRSTHGELRLTERDGLVFGDYADVGVLVGRRSDDTVFGRFVNEAGDLVGFFDFTLDGADRFVGGWRGPAGRGAWNGTRTATLDPVLRNFGGPERGDDAAGLGGRWSSTFGGLELGSKRNVVAGFYTDVGVIYGVARNGVFDGFFTNGDRRGVTRWTIANGAFSGRWRWRSDVNWRPREWTGERKGGRALRLGVSVDHFFVRGEHSFNPICGPDEVDVYGDIAPVARVTGGPGPSLRPDRDGHTGPFWSRSFERRVKTVAIEVDIDQPVGLLFCDFPSTGLSDGSITPAAALPTSGEAKFTIPVSVMRDSDLDVRIGVSATLKAWNRFGDDHDYFKPRLQGLPRAATVSLREVLSVAGDDFTSFTTLLSSPASRGDDPPKRAFVRMTLRRIE